MTRSERHKWIPSRMGAWTLARKLHASFGVVILLLATSALASLWWISRIQHDLSSALEAEGPLQESLQQMELYADRIVEEVTKYVAEKKAIDKEQTRVLAGKFREASSVFGQLSTNAGVQESTRKTDLLFNELQQSGDDLMSRADRQYAAMELFRQKVEEMRKSLDQYFGNASRQNSKKQEALFGMIMSIDNLSDAIEAYANAPTRALREQRRNAEAAFEDAHKAYQSSDPSEREKSDLIIIEKLFLELQEAANSVFSVTEDINIHLDSYEESARKLDAYFNKEIQPFIYTETVRAIENAQESFESAGGWLFLLVLAGMALGLVSALTLTRSIVRPVSKLVHGAEEIGGGNLSHRIELKTGDEFEDLGAAFNKMTENLQASQTGLERRTEELQQEIAERKRTEEALRESREQYRRLNESLEETVKQKVAELQQAQSLAALGQVVAVVAHEIRNPLQNITFAVDEMKETTTGDSRNLEILDRIGFGVTLINGIVSELLQYSRPVSLHPAITKIGDIVGQALHMVRDKLNNIAVNMEIGEEEQQVCVDSEKMIRVLVNIMTNALDAMPGGGTLRIYGHVVVNESSKKFVLGISDTGAGIAPETLKRIWDPFFTTKSHGTGLGIPICEKIVSAHHGELVIHSRLNEGTTVEIQLPV